jgi:hypothetical protein
MIHTIQQANNHNTLLDIKERIEERYRPKTGFNIINKMPRITFISKIEADLKDSEIHKNSTIHKNSVGVGESGNHYNFKISIQKQNQSPSFFCNFDFGFGFQQLRFAIGFDQDFWRSFACCYMLPSEQLVIR